MRYASTNSNFFVLPWLYVECVVRFEVGINIDWLFFARSRRVLNRHLGMRSVARWSPWYGRALLVLHVYRTITGGGVPTRRVFAVLAISFTLSFCFRDFAPINSQTWTVVSTMLYDSGAVTYYTLTEHGQANERVSISGESIYLAVQVVQKLFAACYHRSQPKARSKQIEAQACTEKNHGHCGDSVLL